MKTVVDLVRSLKSYFLGKDELIESSIAPVESDPSDSSRAYSIGDPLYIDDVLYEAIASIAIHDALIEGTNIQAADSISKQLKNYVGLYGTKEIQAATDLNTMTTVGNYFKEGTTFAVTNAPAGLTTNAAQFRLTVEKSLAFDGDTRQVITDLNDIMYVRSYSGGSWSTWKKLEGVIELTQTLAAGNTQVTFTDSAITANCSVNIQTDSPGLAWTNVDNSTAGTLIYTFQAQSSPTSVKLIIRG